MDDYVKRPAAAALACATALGLLALFVYGSDSFRHVDLRVFSEILVDRETRARQLAHAIAKLGDPLPLLVLLAVAVGIALLRGRRTDALAAAAVVAGANLTTQALKVILAHPRAQLLLGGSGVTEAGFPSGHTTAAFSIAIAFAFVVPSNMVPAALFLGAGLGLAMGFSVVALGSHFPSDAIGGFLVAASWGFAVLAAKRAVSPRERSGAGLSSSDPLPSP